MLRADDNDEGGTFASYSLLCQYAQVNLIPNCQLADEELSEYTMDSFVLLDKNLGSCLKLTLKKYRVFKGVGFGAFNVKRASSICTSSNCLYNTSISVCSPTL